MTNATSRLLDAFRIFFFLIDEYLGIPMCIRILYESMILSTKA